MKKSALKSYIREEIISVLSEEMSPAEATAKKANIAAAQEKIKDAQAQLQTATTPLEKNAATAALKAAQEDLKQANAIKESEDEDAEPSAADLKKKDSVTSAANKLQKLTAEMKKLAKEYQAAEGDKKEKIKDELKKMTAEKKKLEASL